VPERLEDAIAEPEDEEIADGLLAEVVVDAIDLRLAEDLADLAIEPFRGVEIVPERLLDDHPAPAAVVLLLIEPHRPELRAGLRELRRLRREIEEPVATRPAFLVDLVQPRREPLVPGRVGEVAALVGDPLLERLPDIVVEREDAAELLERVVDLLAEGP